MLTVQTKGLANLEKTLKVEHGRHKKALETAIRVRGFKLMGQMKKEIRAGAPGGRRFAGLSFLARRRGAGNRLRPDKPLSRLAVAVRYHIPKREPLNVSVGFTHPSLSKSWQRIALKQQEGFSGKMSDVMRQYYRTKAGQLSLRAQGRRQLFLKKTTRTFRTPARPIIAPFWQAHRNESMRKIRRDFRAKIQGKRI